MKIMLKAISLIAIAIFVASIRPAYSQGATEVVKTTTVTVGSPVYGTVITGGDIINSAGEVVGHLTSNSSLTTGDLIAGTIDANGNIIDTNGIILAHAVAFAPSTTTTTTKTVTTAVPTVTKEVLVTPATIIVNGHPLAYSVGDPSVDARRHELELRIGQDVVDGKITPTQASDLRSDIDELVALEANLMKGGCLSNEQARVLFVRYDHIGSKLDEFVAYNRRVTM